MHLQTGIDTLKVAKALAADPNVEYAEPDYLAHAAFTPNDPRYPDQWGLPKIQAEQAWDVTQGSPAVAIAVIDTGIDLNHPDMAGKLWVNPGETPDNGVDDDANGYVDDVNGWDWVNNDNDPQDDIGHGSHVAGVAAAATDNGLGVAGVCPNCRVMALKVLDAAGSGIYSDIAAGIIYSADKGAKVINLSLGSYADSQLLEDAVAYASQFAVVIAAAGNDNKQDRFYPAAYDDYVVSVAATDNNDQRAAFANYGDWVDISAPGVSIWSTLYDDNYAAWSGSSMAVSFVSGVAGLVQSQNPSWSAGAVRGQLLHTADDIDVLNPGYEGKLGVGRLNAFQAATVAAQPEMSIVGYAIDGEDSGNPEPGSAVTMTVSLHNLWGDASSVMATLSTSDTYVTLTDDTAAYGDIVGYGTVINTVDTFGFEVDAGAPYNHGISFNLGVTGNGGAYSTAIPLTVTVSRGIEYVSGVINVDTTWIGGRTYVLTQDVLVSTGATLTIEPGVLVEGGSDNTLQIDGTLIAIGTPAQEIDFDQVKVLFTDTSVDAIYDQYGNYLSGSTIQFARLHDMTSYETTFGVCVEIRYSSPYLGYNTITGCNPGGVLTYDASPVFKGNTISFNGPAEGGIRCYLGDPLIEGNLISHNGRSSSLSSANGSGITQCSRVVRNIVVYNEDYKPVGDISAVGIAGGVWIEGNLIAHNTLYGVSTYHPDDPPTAGVTGANVISNTIFDNQIIDSDGKVASGAINLFDGSLTGSCNNLIANFSPDLGNSSPNDVTFTNNWWGTTNTSEIDERIYDYYDDWTLGIVTYTPILESPCTDAPAYLANLSTDPPSPVGNGLVTFTLDFSKPMSTTVQPTMTFGMVSPYDTHVVIGSWTSSTQWQGTYNVTYYTGDGTHHLRVTGAEGADDGMEIPEDIRFTLEIATIGATSINVQPGYGYVDLSWDPSDLEILAGYNLYRSTISGGPYTRLNDTVLTTTSYTDTDITNGTTYYYVVRLLTTDLYEVDYGSEKAATPNDYTGPTTPVVTDDGTCTPYHDRLHAGWSASDPDSGISEYQYSIGTWTGGTDVINWTSAGIDTEVTRTGLSLIEGVTYYVNVKAKNGVGTWSGVGSSDGITINSGCPVADFTASPTSGLAPLEVQFTDASVGTVANWSWDFGDGGISTEANPAHTYTAAGSYTVSLTVSGTAGSNQLVREGYIQVTGYIHFLPLVIMNH